MNKRARSFSRPLSDYLGVCLGPTLAKQGFASAELITRWAEIAGAEIAETAEPIRIQWPRSAEGEPGTLALRVEGPAALEIQHLGPIIIERVNRFFGWRAIGRITLKQAPLNRRTKVPEPKVVDPAVEAAVAERLPPIADEALRDALLRLGLGALEAARTRKT